MYLGGLVQWVENCSTERGYIAVRCKVLVRYAHNNSKHLVSSAVYWLADYGMLLKLCEATHLFQSSSHTQQLLKTKAIQQMLSQSELLSSNSAF